MGDVTGRVLPFPIERRLAVEQMRLRAWMIGANGVIEFCRAALRADEVCRKDLTRAAPADTSSA